mmetsp:Transcript_84171/g.234688  ORF Transcript_84171/g.234688 Transcript_84171/m.234688 type:complete len:252 (-) Transcript_84171:249-1004(-)
MRSNAARPSRYCFKDAVLGPCAARAQALYTMQLIVVQGYAVLQLRGASLQGGHRAFNVCVNILDSVTLDVDDGLEPTQSFHFVPNRGAGHRKLRDFGLKGSSLLSKCLHLVPRVGAKVSKRLFFSLRLVVALVLHVGHLVVLLLHGGHLVALLLHGGHLATRFLHFGHLVALLLHDGHKWGALEPSDVLRELQHGALDARPVLRHEVAHASGARQVRPELPQRVRQSLPIETRGLGVKGRVRPQPRPKSSH